MVKKVRKLVFSLLVRFAILLWLVRRMIRAIRLARAHLALAEAGRTALMLGSRKHPESSAAYRFLYELGFWLGIYGIGQRSGGGDGAMKAGNEGATKARRLIDAVAKLSKDQDRQPTRDEVMELIRRLGPWKHVDEIVMLADLNRLPQPHEAVLSQIRARVRPASVGVPTDFLMKEKRELPNEHIDPELLMPMAEFEDRHDILFNAPDVGPNQGPEAVIIVTGKLGTMHEFFDYINRVKHGRLAQRQRGRPLPPVYLADPDNLPDDPDPEADFWLQKIQFLGARYVTPEDLHCVRLVDYQLLPYVLEDILYHFGERRVGGNPHVCGAKPGPLPRVAHAPTAERTSVVNRVLPALQAAEAGVRTNGVIHDGVLNGVFNGLAYKPSTNGNGRHHPKSEEH